MNVTVVDICALQQAAIQSDFGTTQRNIVAIFPLIYAIPSIALGIILICLLLSGKGKKEFSSSFYLLFGVTGIVDIVEWILYYYVQRLSTAPAFGFVYIWIPKDGFIVSMIYFSIWKSCIKIVLLIYFVYPMLFSWHYLFFNEVSHCQIWNVNFDYSYHMFALQPPNYWIPLHLAVTIVAFTASILCLIMNLVTLKIIFSLRSNVDKQTKIGFIEIKLFIVSLLMFLNEFSLGVMMMISYLVDPTNPIRRVILFVQQFILDVICLSPPWILIIMCRQVRKKVFELLPFYTRQSHSNTTSIEYNIRYIVNT